MDMDLGNQPSSVECPNCGTAIEVLVNQVVAEETVVCPNCQAEVQLKDKRGAVSRAEAEAEAALEKLQHAVEESGTAAGGRQTGRRGRPRWARAGRR